MRDNQYTTEGRIRFSEVDHTRRITLPGIVNYFQDCRTVSGDRREDTDQYLGDRFQGIVRGA